MSVTSSRTPMQHIRQYRYPLVLGSATALGVGTRLVPQATPRASGDQATRCRTAAAFRTHPTLGSTCLLRSLWHADEVASPGTLTVDTTQVSLPCSVSDQAGREVVEAR